MSVIITPQSFLLFEPKGKEHITAQTAYAIFRPRGREYVRPQSPYLMFRPKGAIHIQLSSTFMTFRLSPQERTETAATVRNVAVSLQEAVQTCRTVGQTEMAIASAIRVLQEPSESSEIRATAVTVRNVGAFIQEDVWTCRNIGQTEMAIASAIRDIQAPSESSEIRATAVTVRNVGAIVQEDVWTCRSIGQTEMVIASAFRILHESSMPVAVADVPTCRNIAKTETAVAATLRSLRYLSEVVAAEASMVRDVVSTNHLQTRICRELFAVQIAEATAVIQTAVAGKASVSLERTVYKTSIIPVDTARRIPYILRSLSDNPLAPYAQAGVQSIFVTLSERTLSDTFQMTTTKPLSIEDEVKGTLMDYSYRFLVEETSRQNLVQTVKGMYGVDEMLYCRYMFMHSGTMCSTYVKRIAKAIGLELSMSFKDYEMSEDYAESGMTYHDMISTLFGWTTRLPQRQINVFIRGNTLHIIQRGMESSVQDISSWPHTRPLVNRKLVRSLWHPADEEYDFRKQAHSFDDDKEVPFSGVIGVGEVYLRYENGYLVYETNNGDETKYRYDGDYLVSKISTRKDGTTIKTDYEYYKTQKDIYLMLETEVTHHEGKTTEIIDTDGQYGEHTSEDNKTSTRTTYHAPIGGGWYLTSVYVDKKFQGSSLSQGPPGGKASQYMVNAMNRHLTRSIGSPHEPIALHGTSLIDTSFPVKGEVLLRELTKAIEWLNRKTQEDVSLEIVANVRNGVPDINHVIDFTERVKLDGHEYFLVSNNIELTPRSLKQKLNLVRWY